MAPPISRRPTDRNGTASNARETEMNAIKIVAIAAIALSIDKAAAQTEGDAYGRQPETHRDALQGQEIDIKMIYAAD